MAKKFAVRILLLLLAALDGRAWANGLSRTVGLDLPFRSQQCAAYSRLKNDTQNTSSKVQWSLRDLDSGLEVASSGGNSQRRFFGASTSKMFVAAALLEEMKGKLTSWQRVRLDAMIISSSNTAWTELQVELGRLRRTRGLCSSADSDWTCGQRGVASFTNRRGYKNTRGYSGNLLGVHGNELNARETSRFLMDTYKDRYPGARVLWNAMERYRTGNQKGNKYLPSRVFVGGKTGTYSGPSEVNGVKTHVNARNIAMFFKGKDGRQYGLTVLSDDGRDETVALLAGGVAREYAGIGNSCGRSIADAPTQAVGAAR